MCRASELPCFRCVLTANILLHKPAIQSSTYYSYGASLANDGILGQGELASGHCSRAKRRNSPMWRVSLEGTFTVGTVKIFNRRDRNTQGELNGVEVWVGSNSQSPTATNNTRCSPTTSYKYSRGSPGYPFTTRCGLKGSYLFVRIPRAGAYLSLCEVVAYETGSTCGAASCESPLCSPPRSNLVWTTWQPLS